MSRRLRRQVGVVLVALLLVVVGGSAGAAEQTAPARSGAPAAGTPWGAAWIGRDTPAVKPLLGAQNRAPLLRDEFSLGANVSKATLRIVGLGYYQAWINGGRVGRARLDPAPSQYDKTAYFRSYDVTAMVRQGDNAIGVELGRSYFATPDQPGVGETLFGLSRASWWQEPRLLARLDVTLSDGTTRSVVSDDSWRIADGPTRDALYYGESYDAREEKPGWTLPGYDASSWEQAPEQPAPTAAVVPAVMPPVVVTQTIRPVATKHPVPGTTVYDFGRMTAGWARIHVSGTAGTTVRLTYGEQLTSGGTIPPALVGSHVDTYTLKGGGPETWEPSFTRHGFRYVQVTSAPTAPDSFSIEARVAHTDLETTGRFTTSNGLLDKIHTIQQHALLNNLWGLPSDTPWRDRQGWTADAYLYLDGAALNYGVEGLYRAWIRTLRDAQLPDGTLPAIAPYPTTTSSVDHENDPSWGGTLILDVWKMYQYYGKRHDLSDSYRAMTRWVDLMRRTIATTGHLYDGESYGDWASPGSEANGAFTLAPPEGSRLTANADLYQEVRTLARIARRLGHARDARRYDALAGAIRRAFNREFLDAGSGTYTTGNAGYRQTSNLAPLAYGMVPRSQVDEVVAGLVRDIVRRGYDLDTGAIGTKMLLPVLTAHGRGGLAYRLATQTDYPSWGRWVRQGATTSWEVWSITGALQSQDHAFLGTAEDWFYADLAGIRPAAPGYRRVRVQPLFPARLDHAAATVTTARGPVSSSWRRRGDRVVLTVRIPRATTAVVRVPRADGGYRVHHVGSGRHVFRAQG